MTGRHPGRLLLIVVSVAVAMALGVALWTLGTPGSQRDVTLDQLREAQLRQLERAIERHWLVEKQLPASLGVIATRPGVRMATVDPVTAAAYGYRITGERSYQLCATFATDSAEAAAQGRRTMDIDWPHGVGTTCFDRSFESADTSPAKAAAASKVVEAAEDQQ